MMTRIDDDLSPGNVTAVQGDTAMLVCTVVNIGDKSVCTKKTKTFSSSSFILEMQGLSTPHPSTNVIIKLQFFMFFTAWKKLQKNVIYTWKIL
jgi:hypothetical protein